ncbi:MAG: NAD-dependent epimerase/dehydratase family protein [Calditrichia bacterium]
MKYFLTGATGFVGSWVAEKLTEKQAEVVCLVRPTSNLQWLEHLPVKYHRGSLFQPGSIEKAVEDADYILHIAGVTKALHREDYYKGNVETTRNLLKMVEQVNPGIKKFVLISSQAAAGPSPTREPIDESFPPRPISDYGKSKLQSEIVAKEYGDKLPITILRPPTVYGPRDSDVLEVFKNIKRGVSLKVGSVEQYISMIHVFDLAAGIILAAESGQATGKTFFICDDQAYPWSEIVNILKEVMGRRAVNVTVPYPLAYGVATVAELLSKMKGKPTVLNRRMMKEIQQPNWVISNKKIKTELHFSPGISLDKGLKITYDWYREHKWL